MKKTIIISLIAFVFLITGCTTQTSTSKQNKTKPTPETDQSSTLFSNENFSINLPAEYLEQNNVIKPKNKNDFNQIVFRVATRDKELSQAELVQWEKDNIEAMCKDTSSCGSFTSSQNVTVNNINGIKFLIKYAGRGIDKLEGFTNEYYYSFSNENNHVRLWTSADNQSNYQDIEKQFNEIISTISFK